MKRILFTYSLLLFPLLLWGQSYNFQHYSLGEGLPQSQVYALLQDRLGYIWMGTQGGGLSRFDGTGFQTFNSRDGLLGNYINTLFEDRRGRLWIGSRQGLSVFDGRRLGPFAPLAERTPKTPVHCICELPSGRLFVGTQAGGWAIAPLTDKLEEWLEGPVSACAIDSAGRLWAGTERGLLLRKAGMWEEALTENKFAGSSITRIYPEADGRLWVAFFGKGLVETGKDSLQVRKGEQGLDEALILDILRGPDGKLWLATQDRGLLAWRPGEGVSEQIYTGNGLLSNHVACLLKDDWGNYWIGTSGGGVSRYAGQQFRHYGSQSPLRAQPVYAISKDTAGRFWLSVGGQGAAIFTDTSYRRPDDPRLRVKSRALFADAQGAMWVGTEGRGLFIQRDSDFVQLQVEDGLSGNWVRTILQLPSGDMMIGTADGGITRILPDSHYQRFTFRQYKTRDGLNSYRINHLLLDRDERLWYASGQGIGYRTPTRFRSIPLPEQPIRCLLEDSLGHIWAGSARNGLYRIRLLPDSVEVLNFDNFTSSNIYLLNQDADGFLWAGSQLGVDRIRLNAEGLPIEFDHFGRFDGFLGIEVCQNATLKDSSGLLWFGTMRGLTAHLPEYESQNQEPPRLHFTDINLFYQSLLELPAYADSLTNFFHAAEPLSFPHNDNHLQFEFSAINHFNPTRVQHRWRLHGLEPDWSPPSRRTQVTYANLAPGNYRFEAMALDPHAGLESAPISFAFVVQQPYWQSWWFRGLILATGLLLVGGLSWWRIRTVKRRAARKQAQLQMENQLLQLEQKALQLQMNPHFIFNVLNTIQAFIVQQEQTTARRLLGQFAQLMRAILQHARKPAVSLREEEALLRNYLALEQISRGERFEFDIQYKDEPAEDLQIPPLMIQPFVENAIVHGIAPLPGGGRISLYFEPLKGGQGLLCTIRDNGIGLEESRRRQRRKYHRSAAIEVIGERLSLLRDEKGMGQLRISEWKKEDGQTGGTLVKIELPVIRQNEKS